MLGDLQNQVLLPRADVEGSQEYRSSFIAKRQTRHFQNLARANGVREDYLLVMVVQSAKLPPWPRQGTILSTVASQDSLVVPKTAIVGIPPARSRGIGKRDLSDNSGMHAVLAIELDGSPIDELVLVVGVRRGTPTGGHAERVGIEHHPMPAA